METASLSRPCPAHSPITFRAVCLGLYASIFINLFSAYNDCYLRNSYFVGNHFPLAAIAFVVFLVLGVNAAARRYFGLHGLSSGELLLIWSMVGLAGSLSSYSVVGYFPSFVVAPAYFANPGNEYAEYLLKHIPDWLVVSRDPDHYALRWFMEGLPAGERIPWGAWAGPLIAWGGFTLLLFAANFALCAVFFQQWSRRERLIFPLVQVTQEVVRDPESGRVFNDFFSNRLSWIGIAIPFVIWGIRGLYAYIPGMPAFQLSWPIWNIFPDRPWSVLTFHNAEVFFTVIGITFLLTREVSFSFWFFYVLYRLSFVYGAWLGAGGMGFFGNWQVRIAQFESAGGMLVLAVFLFWIARRSLSDWLGRAVRGRTDPDTDVLPPRLSMALMVLGLFGMVIWFVLTGTPLWAGVLWVLIFVAMLFVLTRIVAESGLLFLSAVPDIYPFLTGLFPAGWLNGTALTVFGLQRGIHTADMRKVFMPYVINGLKAAEYARLHLGKTLAIFALVTGIGLVIAGYSFVATSYKYGAVNVENWASVMAPMYYLGDPANQQKTPPDYAVLEVGGKPVLPVNLAHVLVGAAVVGGMLLARVVFPWWPLHPFGFIMCATWAIQRIWFSIFIGWVAKTFVMSFGGAHVYRRILPLFIGLAVGECSIAFIYMLVGLVTGVPNQMIVP